MSLKLTVNSFLAGARQSGLVEAGRLDAVLLEIPGSETHSAAALAEALVRRQVLTEWQAEKLLQGRHKGFLLGRYKLLSLLGAGEMSSVYLAEHTMMERRCAIKVLPAAKVKDTSYLGRFHREARAVASLNHTNIVRAYDVDLQSEGGTDVHYLVMEYVEGKNLEKLQREQGTLDVVAAVDIIRQAAEGLHHAHLAGLVHRDVKPENLLIDSQGTVKLLDLGLARFFRSTEVESLTIKHDEKVLGTADYLAPEQAIDSHKVDARADIYSLGCTLYFALCGHPPFTEGTLVQRLLAHQTKTPPSVKRSRPELPDSLVAVLEKMMAKSAASRYQTAAETAAALGQWLVANAPDNWKHKNLGLVATLGGMSAAPASPAKSARQPAVDQVFGDVEGTPIVRRRSKPLPAVPALRSVESVAETMISGSPTSKTTVAKSAVAQTSGTAVMESPVKRVAVEAQPRKKLEPLPVPTKVPQRVPAHPQAVPVTKPAQSLRRLVDNHRSVLITVVAVTVVLFTALGYAACSGTW